MNWFGRVQRGPLAQGDTGRVYLSEHHNSTYLRPPVKLTVNSHIPHAILHHACFTVNDFKKKGAGVTQSMMRKMNPTKCFIREKKLYLNVMTHTGTSIQTQMCSQSNLTFIKYDNLHIYNTSSSFPPSTKCFFLVYQLDIFTLNILTFFSSLCQRVGVYIVLFYLCFRQPACCLATITVIILLAWEALPFPCQPCSHTPSHTQQHHARMRRH